MATSISNHATVLIATRGQSALLIYSEDKHILYILHIVILLCYGMAAMIFLQNFQFIALDGSGFKTVMHCFFGKGQNLVKPKGLDEINLSKVRDSGNSSGCVSGWLEREWDGPSLEKRKQKQKLYYSLQAELKPKQK